MHSKPSLLLLLCVALAAPLFAQKDAPLSGVVSIQNSKRKTGARQFVPGADISAPQAVPTQTDKNGTFSLVFSDVPVGTPIRLSVKKVNLEVVNKRDMADAAVVGRTRPLNIYMCPAGELDARIAEYYDFSVQEYTRSYREKTAALTKRIDQLEAAVRAGQQKTTELEETRVAYTLLENQYKKALEDANRLAEQFALVNLDDESDLYAAALDTFLHGYVPEAIALLESAGLETRLATNAANVEKGEKIIADTQEKVGQSKQQIGEDIRAAMLLGRLYQTQFEFDRAEFYYGLALQYDSTNVENLHDYAHFLVEANRYDKALLWLEKLKSSPGVEAWRVGDAHRNAGEVYKEIGKLPEALAANKNYMTVYDSLQQGSPDFIYKAELAVSYEHLGAIYQELGQFETALLCFVKETDLFEELYRGNPKDVDLKRGLAISYNRLGDLYQALGQFDTALVYFVKQNDLCEELCRDNPKNESPKSGLAISYGRLGNLYKALGQFDTALVYLVKQTNLFEGLYRDNPKNVDLKGGLASSYGRLGDLYKALGQFDTALVYFEKKSQLNEELCRDNPKNVDPKSGLASSYGSLGDLYKALGQFDTALIYYVKGSRLDEELYRDNPKDEDLKKRLAISYSKLGDHYLDLGQFDTALVYFVKQTNLFEELCRDNPKNESLKRGRAISYSKLGAIYQALEQFDTALVYLVRRLQLSEAIYLDNPKNVDLKRGLAISYRELGTIYQTLGQFDTALVCFVKQTDLFEDLCRDNPKNESLMGGLAISYGYFGAIYQALEQFDTALVYLGKQTDLFEELYQKNPKSIEIWLGLGNSKYELGGIHEALGRLNEALKNYERAAAIFKEIYRAFGLEKYRQDFQRIEQQTERLQTPENLVLIQIQNLEQQVEAAIDPAEKAAHQQKLVDWLENLLEQDSGNADLQTYTATACGSLAWYRLFTREFPAAEAAARRAIALHEEAEWVHTNLTVALLYQSRYAEAETIYKKYKGRPYDDERGWTEVFLADLAELEAAGITHPDVARARALLGE